jgi:signal transduction histidine kinase
VNRPVKTSQSGSAHEQSYDGAGRSIGPRLRIQDRLTVAFGIQLLLVAGAAVIGLMGLDSVRQSFQSAIDRGLEAQRLAGEVKNELGAARRAENEFLLRASSLGGEGASDLVALNQLHVARLRERISDLERHDGTAGVSYPPKRTTENVVALRPYVDVYAEDFRAVVELINRRGSFQDDLERRAREMVQQILWKLRGRRGAEAVAATLIDLRRREREALSRGPAASSTEVQGLLGTLLSEVSALDPALRGEAAQLSGRYLDTFTALLALEANVVRKMNDFRVATGVVEPLVDDIAAIGQRDAAATVASAQRASERTVILVGVALLLALLAGLLLASVLGRRITTPIINLARTARAVGTGELTAWAEVKTGDELETLAASFNAMTTRVRSLVESLEERVRERERAEEQVRSLNAELEDRVRARTVQLEIANQELEAFSYSVSHDLRTPLRHIAGFVFLLDEKVSGLDPEARRHMQLIQSAVQRMVSLTDALLAFSRFGRAAMNLTEVALDALVDEARSELSSEAKDRNVVWQIDPLPHVSGDRVLLRQVMINLLSNALKFTQTRPTAEIEIKVDRDRSSRDETVIVVRDNGVGFNMAYVEKLFGVFKRLHPAGEFEGTGIGLANVDRIVRRHGGRVWAESVLGAGASFYVALPAASEPRARAS